MSTLLNMRIFKIILFLKSLRRLKYYLPKAKFQLVLDFSKIKFNVRKKMEKYFYKWDSGIIPVQEWVCS